VRGSGAAGGSASCQGVRYGLQGRQDMPEKNPQKRLGYACVSTVGQTLAAQLDQLRATGCSQIYREKVTGARADRRKLLKLLRAIGPGEVVTVTRIDRLARSTFDLFAIVKQIVDAKAQFRSLAEPWADTATSTMRLMIAVLGGLADVVERDLIRTCTAEGRERAKARGQHMGRSPKLTPQQQKEARRRRAEGATLKELAGSYNVRRATISRLST
jgi:DNA invertase Pin-like site-specific DNA recombinase